jgi:hypothetical protein
MHQFPPSADLQFLLGETFGQIALDPWSIQFRFAAGGQVTVEGQIEHVDEGGSTHPHDCENRTGEALYLHQLLQHPITAVDAEPLCLSLTFASGAILRIFTELGGFECGQIYPPKPSGRGIIVF